MQQAAFPLSVEKSIVYLCTFSVNLHTLYLRRAIINIIRLRGDDRRCDDERQPVKRLLMSLVEATLLVTLVSTDKGRLSDYCFVLIIVLYSLFRGGMLLPYFQKNRVHDAELQLDSANVSPFATFTRNISICQPVKVGRIFSFFTVATIL